jgi:hypothetical protein
MLKGHKAQQVKKNIGQIHKLKTDIDVKPTTATNYPIEKKH